MSVLND